MTTHGAAPISDEYMGEMLGETGAYTLVLLKAGPNYNAPDAGPVKFEHGRRGPSRTNCTRSAASPAMPFPSTF